MADQRLTWLTRRPTLWSAVVPLVAGMSRMAPRDFFTTDAVSAVAWAAAHLLPGMLFGASLQLSTPDGERLLRRDTPSGIAFFEQRPSHQTVIGAPSTFTA